MYYLTIIRIANFFKKPVMIYANGIGPLSRPKNRERVRLAVESAKIVTLRDVQSLEELRQMGVTRDDIEVTGDPVYTIELPSEDECLEIVRDAGIDLSRPFAAVSVRKNPDSAQLFPELAKLCDMIYSQLGIGTVFLPMQPAPDIAASREVRSLMSSPAAVPECDLSPRELVGILSNARFAISMRFHTLVFAARAGTPWAGIIVDPKIEANLEAFGMPGLGAPSEVDANSAFETIKTLLSDREKLSKRLKELSDEQCERTKIDAKKLSELPERLN